jgi:hypothetical protein
MTPQTYSYLDGNAAAGELNRIFALDITAAKGQCANCGSERHFAEAHLYMQCPGIVARCAVCKHVLLRLVDAGNRMVLDVRGMTYFAFEMSQIQESSGAS